MKHLAAAVLLVAAAGHSAPLTPQAQRGQQIYRDGVSPSGAPITATVGLAATEIPAAAVPCAGCHGEDGLGRPEGGVVPPAITWSYLTKAYGHRHPHGRQHPAFDPETVAQAIVHGRDPAGNALDPAMPRYALGGQDLADLIAYLQQLESVRDPGLTEDRIRLATLLPDQGPAAATGQAVRQLLTAYLTALNGRGGVHGRQIELISATFGGGREAALAAAERLLAEGEVFALLSPVTPGTEAALAALAERLGAPVIGPVTADPPAAAVNQFTFYLLAGLNDQSRALVEYAAQTLGLSAPGAAVVYAERADSGYSAAAAAVIERCRERGWEEVTEIRYAPGRFAPAALARRLAHSAPALLFFFGTSAELNALLAASPPHWTPYILLPGATASERLLDAPDRFSGRILLAYPTLPPTATAAGLRQLNALRQRYRLNPRHLSAQLSAYGAAQVLLEGLKRAGKNLSRAKLISALEGLYAFEPGLMPPLTYGPNRRVGARGAYIVAVDLRQKRLRPVSGWTAL